MPMDMKGNTILHFICVNHPPKYVLEKMFGFVEDWFDSCCNHNHNHHNHHQEEEENLALHMLTLVNGEGATPLHKACKFKASSSVVEYLIERCAVACARSRGDGDAVRRTVENYISAKDGNGWTALHLAVRFGASTRVVKLLMKHCCGISLVNGPESVNHGNSYAGANSDAEYSFESGKTAIHLACLFDSSIDVLKALLDDALSYAGMPPPRRNTASHLLHIIWRRFCRMDDVNSNSSVDSTNNVSYASVKQAVHNAKCVNDLEPELRYAWRKILLILRAMYCGTTEEPCNFGTVLEPHVLHAVAHYAPYCPRTLIILMVRMYESCLHVRDSRGRTPLAVLTNHRVHTKQGRRLNGFAMNLFASVAPESVDKCDKLGMYPLHTALETGKKYEDVETILNAAPDVLEKPSGKDGLHPFMISAANNVGCVDAVFQLLRRNPHVLTSLVKKKDSCLGKDKKVSLPVIGKWTSSGKRTRSSLESNTPPSTFCNISTYYNPYSTRYNVSGLHMIETMQAQKVSSYPYRRRYESDVISMPLPSLVSCMVPTTSSAVDHVHSSLSSNGYGDGMPKSKVRRVSLE